MNVRTCVRYVYVQTKSAIDAADDKCDPETSLDTVLECAGTVHTLVLTRILIIPLLTFLFRAIFFVNFFL